MKQTAFNGIFILSILISTIVWSQNKVQGIATYKTDVQIDMSRFEEGNIDPERKKRIMERMKEMQNKVYNLVFNQSESLYQIDNSEAAPQTGFWRGIMMNDFVVGAEYKNISSLEIIQDQAFLGKQFLVMDTLPKYDWKMTNETKKIGDYMCFKATTTKEVPNREGFRKQTDVDEKTPISATKNIPVEAWYTIQIPVNQGPADYWGLPGLILEVVTENTTIYCTKLEINPSEKVEIKKPTKGKKINRKEFAEIFSKKMRENQNQNQNNRNN